MKVKIAGIQIDVRLADRTHNLETMSRWARRAVAEDDVRLSIFPECALSGYCYDSREEAWEHAESADGPACQALVEVARETRSHLIYGYLERRGAKLHNSVNLVGPEGLVGTYRKTHIPYLGVDRFTDTGTEPYEVHTAGELRIGMLICYDGSFPEPSRILALRGADLIALPTNWPPGSGCTANVVPNARALENAVYFAAVNRVGEERGFDFIGQSSLIDTNGWVITSASPETAEQILIAEIDPEIAREKHLKRIPGKHEIHRFRDRRPDLYGPLVEPLIEGPIRY